MKAKSFMVCALFILIAGALLGGCAEKEQAASSGMILEEESIVAYDFEPLTFYSFDEFAFNFSKDANAENSKIQAEKDMYGDKFSKLVNFLNNHNDQILRPLSNGEPMFTASNGQESVLIVELLTEDHYDLPWIWYYLEDKLISVTYPKEVLDVDFDTTPSVEEIYKAMAGDQAIDYNVQNVELDGITVSAIVEGDRSKYSFYYNGMYVSIESNTWRGISDEFLKSFSMG